VVEKRKLKHQKPIEEAQALPELPKSISAKYSRAEIETVKHHSEKRPKKSKIHERTVDESPSPLSKMAMIMNLPSKPSTSSPPDSPPLTPRMTMPVLPHPPDSPTPPVGPTSFSDSTVLELHDLLSKELPAPAPGGHSKDGISKSTMKRKYLAGTIGKIDITNIGNIGNIAIGPIKHKVSSSPPRSGPNTPRKEEIVRENNMALDLKSIFDSLKPIIDKHVEMKPILFEKVTDFKKSPHLGSMLSIFTVLLETYDLYGSVWEEKRNSLTVVLSKKKRERFLEFNALSQQFEEIHMISIDNFLNEISLRAVYIYSMLTELKKVTLPDETDYTCIQDLCTTLEPIHDKIIARKLREKNENEQKNQRLTMENGVQKEEKKYKRASRTMDKTKALLSPTDKPPKNIKN